MKFIKKTYQKYVHPKEVLALQVDLYSGDNLSVNYTHLVIEKSEIIIKDQGESINEKYSHLPVVLCVKGKGILIKNFKDNEINDIENKFPEPDFVKQIVPLANNKLCCAIIRQDTINFILENININRKKITGVFLGPGFISQLHQNSELPANISGYHISWSENEISEIVNEEVLPNSVIGVWDYSVKQSNALGLLAGIYFLLNGFKHPYVPEQFRANFENFVSEKVLKGISIGIVVVLFVSLLTNFFILNSIKDSTNKLNELLNRQSNEIKKVSEIEHQIKKKQNFIRSLNLSSQVVYEQLVDDLARKLPSSIGFKQIEFNPIEKGIKTNQKIEYKTNQLHVYGACKNSFDFNEWKNKLAELNWIKNIELFDFQMDKNQLGDFHLVIQYQ